MRAFFLILCTSIYFCIFSYEIGHKIKVSHLSLEEKIGQMLIAHFHGLTMNQDAEKLIKDLHIGGIIYYQFSNPFENPEQVQKLSSHLQRCAKTSKSKIPLLICVDQEGGFINRLTKGFTLFPSAKAFSNTSDLKLARQCAEALAQELKAVGINMNLAPVVDINSKKNPVIGIRSFGEKTTTVIDFAKAFLKGFRQKNLISCLKHFPGHGSVQVDSHESLPLCAKTKEELIHCELKPYKTLCEKVDCLMTAHVLYPLLDKENCATLSKKILENLLRNEMSYKGVIISDSLIMDGLLKNTSSIEEASVQAINAGCDMLILGGKQLIGERKNFELTTLDIEKIHHFLCQAVLDGKISQTRINEAVERILKLKKSYHLFAQQSLTQDAIKNYVGTQAHAELADRVSTLSFKIESNKELLSNNFPFIIVAPSALSEMILSSKLPKNLQSLILYDNINPSDEEIKQITKQTIPRCNIIFLSYNAWKFTKQKDLLKALNFGPNIITASLSDEADKDLLKDFSHMLITTEDPTPTSLNNLWSHIEKFFNL